MNVAKRVEAEKDICELMDRIEGKKDGYNSSAFKEMFKALSDKEFDEYMKSLLEDPDFNLFFEIDTMGELGTPDMNRIKSVASAYKVDLVQYVAFPHKNGGDKDAPVITKTPVPKLYVPVRRLIQMLEKKNSASANIDQVNPITGQVTGDSKAASMSDTQTCSLATVGMNQTTKEFLGFRADDPVAKMKAIESIEKYGSRSEERRVGKEC